MLQPGTLLSLGDELDQRDAQGLLDVARACKGMRGHRYAGTTHVVNQALWSFWEMPRMGPRVASKYPKAWPWSPDARERYANYGGRKPPGGWQLVYEHVRPRGLIVGGVIDAAQELTVNDLIAHLNQVMAGAVITKVEDAMLRDAGVAKTPLDPNDPDPWTRYRAAGLKPESFAPLDESGG